MNEQSPKWHLSSEDVDRWLSNAVLFLAPVFVIYLGSVLTALQSGFAWSDFTFTPTVQGAIVLYLVNAALDLFRKLAKGATPQ